MVTAVAFGMLDAPLGRDRLSPALLAQAGGMGAARAETFLAGRALLAELMFKVFNRATLPEMTLLAGGKPVFTDAVQPFFNLSHSADRLLVAVSDRGPVGCDIEIDRQRRRLLSIARQYFSAKENDWLNAQCSLQTAFWQLWCQREALVKQTGEGVLMMNAVALNPDAKTFLSQSTALRLCHTANEGCLAALALPDTNDAIQHWGVNAQNNRLEMLPALDWQRFYPASESA
ncbi:4'-phosphopantetheinyl transferase family protein [Rouxiella badensis]|uniref:4'-phosphopantetheinyl transferase family protein n=1 Tax=Rouxiella badensis TaxID=1646377 RepID=UPI00301D32E9